MRISQLEEIATRGGRIALWGWGREGRAAYHAIRSRLPELPLTLFCNTSEADEARTFGDRWLCAGTEVTAEALALHAVVVKSPGISPYRAEAIAAAAQGTRFIGGTALWFAEHGSAEGIATDVLCVTGTKGKSTTSACLRSCCVAQACAPRWPATSALPLLELLDARGRRMGGRIVELPDPRRRRIRRASPDRHRHQCVPRTPGLAWQRSALCRRQAGAADRSQATHRRAQCRRPAACGAISAGQ